MSVSPGMEVQFSDTVLYAAEVLDWDEKPVHVLGYQNKVQGRVGLLSKIASWLPWAGTGNAMILPFPALPKSMSRRNVVDTRKCPEVLQDIARSIAPRNRGLYLMKSMTLSIEEEPVQIFEAAGIYTVVLAQNPRDIRKRPVNHLVDAGFMLVSSPDSAIWENAYHASTQST